MAIVEEVERGRAAGLKRLHPIALEVDGVGEHKVGLDGNVAAGDDGVDEILRGFFTHELIIFTAASGFQYHIYACMCN